MKSPLIFFSSTSQPLVWRVKKFFEISKFDKNVRPKQFSRKFTTPYAARNKRNEIGSGKTANDPPWALTRRRGQELRNNVYDFPPVRGVIIHPQEFILSTVTRNCPTIRDVLRANLIFRIQLTGRKGSSRFIPFNFSNDTPNYEFVIFFFFFSPAVFSERRKREFTCTNVPRP